MTIDGLQSRVYLLQDRLSKAHSEGVNLVISEYSAHVRVPRKMQHTQKHPISYTECRCTKPQKKKNLNVLLKDDDRSALAVRPALPDRETDAHIKDANRNAEERSGECNHLREKYVTMDLLLGTGNSIPNGHIGDLCKENTYDILIDNQAANIAHRQFGKAKHMPFVTSSKGPAEEKNMSTPAEVKNACALVDSTPDPAVEPVSPQSKKELKPKKKRKKGSFLSMRKKRKTSKTPAKEKAEGTPSAAENKTGSTLSAAAMEKTESMPSGAMGLGTMTPQRPRTAGKKCKSVNEFADVKNRESAPSKKQETGRSPSSAAKKQDTEHPSSAAKKQETGKPFSAAKKQETGRASSTAKKQKTENPSSAAKKQETANPSSDTKKQETESAPMNVKTEKAVPAVAVNSRRSQRVRKPKVFAE